MADNETCVVRIVNLDDSFTEFSLRQMIMLKCQPRGNIKSLYLRKDNNVKLLFAYVVFDYGYDAVKIVELLHGHTHIEKKFEVELIGPKLKYQKYEDATDITIDRLFQLKEEHRRLENLRKMTAGRAFMQSPPVNQRLREQAFGNKYGNKCNVCKGAHSTSTCPIFRGGNVADNKTPAASGATDGSSSGIHISNLSHSTTKTDLEDLVKPFGPIQKLYLATDKATGLCFGFASIHFKFRNDAIKAISMLNGRDYNHRNLRVRWCKPPVKKSNQ